MALPLLQSKLFVPPIRPALVPRPRLIARLNEGLHRNLSLVSAPAGFGKTTLVSSWIATCDRPAAWLSLDEGDNELIRFLAYVVTALRQVASSVGEGLAEALHSPQPPPNEAVLTTLINDLSALPAPLLLVLDDYHLIESQPVDNALAFLLEHLPPQLHVVITTREDPPLPLPRLRARGELTEVRVADLRFSPAEAAAFLNQTMGLGLSSEEIALLQRRTEGWIAGLQMVALSIRGREEVTGFIEAFAGDHRYIVDYLVEEVLEQQPEHIRTFLLQSSILERLSGPLCEAVTTQAGSDALLEALERGNLFVLPLDDRRQWYRYHHLFADVLRARLMKERPEQLKALHQRASNWYAAHGSPADAIRHALAAENWEQSAALIERAWPSMDQRRRSATWLRWAQALPEGMVRRRPVLSAGYGWALLDRGELERAEIYLQVAERWLDKAAPVKHQPEGTEAVHGRLMDIVDGAASRSLEAIVALARAYQAQARGQGSASMSHARRALDLLPEEEHLRRGMAGAMLGLTLWARGELEAAHATFAAAMVRFERADNLLFAITGTYVLADIRLAQGRLREAIRTYERALRRAERQSHQRGTAELHLGLAMLLRERGAAEAAADHLRRSEALGERVPLPRWKYHWCLSQAQLKQWQGELDDALDLLDEAARHYVPGPVPNIRPVAALKARVWVAQGRVDRVLEWVREQDLSIHDDLSYPREVEHLTLARVFLARYESEAVESALQQAVELLERLLQAAERGGRKGSMIDILILQALAHAAQRDTPAALRDLERALVLAEPEGFMLRFVGEGAPMARLLSEAASRGLMPAYTRRLLVAFDEGQRAYKNQPSPPSAQALIEPLSERELEVLALVAEGLSNREIGERLFLALNTVKGHNRNIFGKLQVRRRTEAVARARELGLL